MYCYGRSDGSRRNRIGCDYIWLSEVQLSSYGINGCDFDYFCRDYRSNWKMGLSENEVILRGSSYELPLIK